MKTNQLITGFLIATMAVLGMTNTCNAQDAKMFTPTAKHELLNQFEGEWEMIGEAIHGQTREVIRWTGIETTKMLGGYWMVSQLESSLMGVPVKSLMTIGYSQSKKKYVGTYVSSMGDEYWKYEGLMDETGNKLTLETEGPSAFDFNKQAKYREVLELKGVDYKVFNSFVQDDDGNWMNIVKLEYHRKK